MKRLFILLHSLLQRAEQLILLSPLCGAGEKGGPAEFGWSPFISLLQRAEQTTDLTSACFPNDL